MNKEEFLRRLYNACEAVKHAEADLTEIDAKFGDADHGYTMTKIANVIEQCINESTGSIKQVLDDISIEVSSINGGSAVPLWSTWLEGLQEGAPDSDELTDDEIRGMFKTGYEAISDMSGAQVGDKTMMDALIPATETIIASTEDIAVVMKAAAIAAGQGAANTKNFKSKYGRAKAYGDKTIGTPDAGAISMACFFRGLSENM